MYVIVDSGFQINHDLVFLDYSMAYGFGSILPAVTVASIFTQHYNFSTLAIGLAYGGALTIGALVGEFGGGIVVDRIVNRERRRKRESAVEPEARLKAIWTGEILVPVSNFYISDCKMRYSCMLSLDRSPALWIWSSV